LTEDLKLRNVADTLSDHYFDTNPSTFLHITFPN